MFAKLWKTIARLLVVGFTRFWTCWKALVSDYMFEKKSSQFGSLVAELFRLKDGIYNSLLYAHSVPNFRIGSAENLDLTWPDPNPKTFISRSSNPISAIFFLLDRARRPLHNIKKIAEIGLVDREIIAKNDFSTPDQSWLRRITDRSVRNTIYNYKII